VATGECCFTAETQRTLRSGLLLGRSSKKRGLGWAHDEKVALLHRIANVNAM